MVDNLSKIDDPTSNTNSNSDNFLVINKKKITKYKNIFLSHKNSMEIFAIKYYIILSFCNDILNDIGLRKINKLTDFKDIKRELIVREQNKKILNNYLPIIHEYFGNHLCTNSEKSIKNYILTILKNTCAQIALNVTKRYKNKQVNGYISSMTLYSIEEMTFNDDTEKK